MQLEPTEQRMPAAVPAPMPPLVVTPAPGNADPCLAPDDLTVLDDAELYALEADRCLQPREWQRVESELQRRRQGRRVAESDIALGAVAPPIAAATVGDIERVASQLEARLADRMAEIESRTRSLRWWTMAAPLAWSLAALAGLGVWSLMSSGSTWTTFQAALLG